jgi:hypothetical protein
VLQLRIDDYLGHGGRGRGIAPFLRTVAIGLVRFLSAVTTANSGGLVQ